MRFPQPVTRRHRRRRPRETSDYGKRREDPVQRIRSAAAEPLYVESGVLCTKQLTGIGRFAARLLEALARITPLRLVSTLTDPSPRRTFVHNAILRGEELSLTAA